MKSRFKCLKNIGEKKLSEVLFVVCAFHQSLQFRILYQLNLGQQGA